MSQTLLLFFLVGLLFSDSVHGSKGKDVEGCSIGTTHENANMRTFYLKDLENNAPKKNELFRLKWYFNGKSPAISVAEGEKQLVFGHNHKNADHFGIFLTHEDWMSAENACYTEVAKNIFSLDSYTEIDASLELGGFFSLFFCIF